MGYQGINTLLRKTFLSPQRFFVPREHRWGNHIYMGKYMGLQYLTRGDEIRNICFRGI
jgi:hypothetical protein